MGFLHFASSCYVERISILVSSSSEMSDSNIIDKFAFDLMLTGFLSLSYFGGGGGLGKLWCLGGKLPPPPFIALDETLANDMLADKVITM